MHAVGTENVLVIGCVCVFVCKAKVRTEKHNPAVQKCVQSLYVNVSSVLVSSSVIVNNIYVEEFTLHFHYDHNSLWVFFFLDVVIIVVV